MPVSRAFSEILSAAIDDLMEHGYDSEGRVKFWTDQLAAAAQRETASPARMEEMLSRGLRDVYARLIDKGGIARFHQGVGRFTVEKLRPVLRAELDRRIMAGANLIKLNRDEMKAKTLRRFQGWATSIPKGGTDALKKSKVKEDLKKALGRLPFEERRVLIDQGHKLTASLSEILARDGQAIAVIWHSHWRQAGYDYREDHRERDGQCYLLEKSWAHADGLVKPGKAGYYESITSVGEEVFCRCYGQWIYNLRSLPADMLTVRGKKALEEAKRRAV